ncbi:nucleolar pre-ribosomal-associated protein 1 [Battus philenor]|uniref:nucleolar pre-ribosomal-associated protein 1 n=1 Tax=Battus philenor TaxID=42288 RepID=UPI0035CF9FE6
MGKRKYESEGTKPVKKAKEDENLEITPNEESEQPINQNISSSKRVSKKHDFDMKHFRKELSSKQGQTMVLTQFLNVCLDPDNEVDYILEYLKVGGNSHEILRQITQDNKKNLTLVTPACHLFYLIIVKVQSSLPHMIAVTEEACRYFLNTFIPTVEIMISENSGPRHRKIILNLLTSMVTLNSDLGVEILNQLPLTPKHLQYIIEKPNYKEKDNVRTTFVHFMTSFLIEGHLPLTKALLEKQGLLGLVIPGLVQDDPEAVLMFLNILKKNIVDNPLISKTLKLKTFSQQVLHNMFKVFSWKGPPEMSSEIRNGFRPDITSLLTDIMITLFTSHKLGLYFIDNSLGTTDTGKNQNLYKSLLSLKRPWENEIECEVILEIIFKCPDLHRAIVNVVEQSFLPQHSPIWTRTLDFTIKLIDKLKPEDMADRMKVLSPLQSANFVRFITLPVPLLKHIQPNIGKDKTISFYCAKVLIKMLQSLKRYIKILDADDSSSGVVELKNKLEYFIPKHLPQPAIIVSLIQEVIDGSQDEPIQDYNLPKFEDAEALLVLIELLILYNDIHPAFFESIEGNIDMKRILDHSTKMSNQNTSLLKFKIVSLWLMLDNSAVSVSNPMFKELFRIMLDVYTNDTDDTWVEAKDILQMFFKNTTIFEGDEEEIHLILYTLRNVKINPASLLSDVVEYVIANKKDLTEMVRSQIVHFEITDAGKEDNLETLFNDLLKNKSNDNNVFMENKVPSPFIVGCMQYRQSNKDAKKNLKHFLSLYVANLLHCNFSPEMTEILMGDSKLDVRNYVASWVGEPIPLPELIVGKDKVLHNLSRSLIGKEDLTLKDIFVYLEESSEEEKDIIISNRFIKITGRVDSSELIIWARYLVFCLVKLTHMNKLTQTEEEKLETYIDCLIAFGRRNHLINTCRDIISNIFKSSHVLNIYSPIDLNRNESKTLATKLMLHLLTQHSDIVNYLDNKQHVLRPYRMKNFKEIIKTLIKIKKRKEVNSDHTVRVLKEVGLRKEDDILILKHIFDAELSTCYKNDKEPSVLLEILCVLIQKYSKTITLDLSQDVFQKTMNLYAELLKNAEINVNLTIVEEALITFFIRKPNYATRVSENVFKAFFQSNTIRKTTSHLASILLQFNKKFCNVFKDEMNREEILSQRELTLPLGNAILNHNILSNQKELLLRIYEEYKSNINKYLEKPHKAGQIYLKCWRFIRKLILECMDVQSCLKMFTKTHKFEAIDFGHVNLYNTIFLKICVLNEQLKIDYLINYFQTMLHTITTAVKDELDVNVVNEIVRNIVQVIQISETIKEFQVEKDNFVKVTESSAWQTFCKTVLKHSLKVKTANQEVQSGPKLICLLTKLIKLFYPLNHNDVVTIFDMVTSHSEFLNVMLSYYSPEIKLKLLEILHTLITINKSVMKSQQIPVYLSAYGASRSPCDRVILSILYLYESNELPVNEYKPYVWGDTAANYYAVRKNRTSSLWGHPTPNQVLNLFDKELIERTVKNFPVTQKLEYTFEISDNYDGNDSNESLFNANEMNAKSIDDNEMKIKKFVDRIKFDKTILPYKENDVMAISHVNSDSEIYDPVFVLSLLSHLLAPGTVASSFKLLRSGMLSIPVMALSSHCPLMRSAAYHVLHRFNMLLETETRHKNDKLLLSDFISTLRHSLSSAINGSANGDVERGEANNPRLPAVSALYLARALMVSTAPFDPLYKPVNNFFIAKQFVDLSLVPDFLSLFHDSDMESADRRQWILEVIGDGTKTMTDVNVVFKSMCLKMMMDFYSTVLCDKKTKEKILNALNSIVRIPRALEILIGGYGILSWLHCCVGQIGKEEKNLVLQMCDVIKSMLYSLRVTALAKAASVANGKTNEPNLRVDKDVEFKLMLLAYELSKHLDGLDYSEVSKYINIFELISKRTLKFLTKKQIQNLIRKCTSAISDESVGILSRAITAGPVVLKSKSLEDLDYNSLDKCIIKDLSKLIQTYLA